MDIAGKFGIAAILTFAWTGTAFAQVRTEVIVHVDRTIQRSQLTIQFPDAPKTEFGEPYERTAFYNNYRAYIPWPAGARNRRSDFELFARVQESDYTSYYLRLRRDVGRVEIYVFRPQVRECELRNFRTPHTDDEIFQQLAVAESMLLISSSRGRCSIANLQNWTNIWLERLEILRNRNVYVRINPRIVHEIRRAYATPRGLPLLRRTPQLPARFGQVLDRDHALSVKFSER